MDSGPEGSGGFDCAARGVWSSVPVVASGVVLIMLLAPTTIGAVPHVVTIIAPYKGTWSPYASEYGGGCGGARQVKSPYWSSSTGIGGFAMAASASKCAKSVGGIGTQSNEFASDSFTVSIPVKGFTSGNHTVTANWTMTVKAAESTIVKGTCPLPPASSSYTYSNCAVSADVYMGFSACCGNSPSLVDLTTGVWQPMTNSWGGYGNSIGNQTQMTNDTYCYSGSCYYTNYSSGSSGGFSGTYTSSFLWNASGQYALNASHHYVLVITLGAHLDATVTSNPYGYPSAHVSAAFNVGSSGNSWKLNWITIA